MYTVCPNCSSVHALKAVTLASSSGKVRCARCGETFSALDALYDDYPDGRRKAEGPRAGETLPELGRKPAPDVPRRLDDPPATDSPAARRRWLAALGVLLVVTTINLFLTFRDEIPRDSALGSLFERWSVPGFEPRQPYRDPTRIHLLSRDIHAHPTRPGVLVLSATFTNLADQAQAFPDVSVALKNPEGHVIAARRFEPADYLVRAEDVDPRLGPGQQVPLLLEFADPGERATGFELRFH